MTWQQQVRGLKRQLSGKIKNPAALARKRAQAQAAKQPRPSPVYVSGAVAPGFLRRMGALGISIRPKVCDSSSDGV